MSHTSIRVYRLTSVLWPLTTLCVCTVRIHRHRIQESSGAISVFCPCCLVLKLSIGRGPDCVSCLWPWGGSCAPVKSCEPDQHGHSRYTRNVALKGSPTKDQTVTLSLMYPFRDCAPWTERSPTAYSDTVYQHMGGCHSYSQGASPSFLALVWPLEWSSS